MDLSGVKRAGLVAPVRRDPLGVHGPTKAQTRGSSWRRSSHGLYVPSEVDGTAPEQRIVEAAAVMPDHAGIEGWASLCWRGSTWTRGVAGDRATLRPVDVAVGGNRCFRNQPGIRPSEERMRPRDVERVDGLPVTVAARAVCFQMRYARSLRDAVRALDMAAYDDLVSIEEACAYAIPYLQGWTGVPQCRHAIALAEENVWSPMETDLRLLWVVDLELPRPLCNPPVFDLRGHFIGTPDLLDAEAGLVLEYDGKLHLEGSRRATDLRREAAFRSVGLEYVTMVAADRRDPSAFVRRALDARERQLRSGPDRRWTVEQPPWWVPTQTVAQRRALSLAQRSQLLRYRLAA